MPSTVMLFVFSGLLRTWYTTQSQVMRYEGKFARSLWEGLLDFHKETFMRHWPHSFSSGGWINVRTPAAILCPSGEPEQGQSGHAGKDAEAGGIPSVHPSPGFPTRRDNRCPELYRHLAWLPITYSCEYSKPDSIQRQLFPCLFVFKKCISQPLP